MKLSIYTNVTWTTNCELRVYSNKFQYIYTWQFSPFISAANCQAGSGRCFVLTDGVRKHGNGHHEVLGARGQIVGVQRGGGRPTATAAIRSWSSSYLVRVSYAPLDVNNLPYYVGWVPRVLLGEEGDRLLGQVVVWAVPVDRLVVPSRIPNKDGKLMDFKPAKGYLLLAGLLNSFPRDTRENLLC